MIKLVDARKNLYEKCVELFHNEKVAESIYMYLCDGIEECNEVESERKKGKWMCTDDLYEYGVCSCCGLAEEVYEYVKNWNYCPNCGADMRGERHDK